MNQRVERLDPAVHHLGKAGHVGYADHVEPGLLEGSGSPPSRN
jgi:hypothetical protein